MRAAALAAALVVEEQASVQQEAMILEVEA